MLLETQVGMLFEPPGRYLTLTDATENWRRRFWLL
jgi:hypothetical protein